MPPTSPLDPPTPVAVHILWSWNIAPGTQDRHEYEAQFLHFSDGSILFDLVVRTPGGVQILTPETGVLDFLPSDLRGGWNTTLSRDQAARLWDWLVYERGGWRRARGLEVSWEPTPVSSGSPAPAAT